MATYNNYPLHECIRAAEELVAHGAVVHQKYSCEKCDARLAIPEPNTFHDTGSCDRCGHVTNIRLRGCNYLVIRKL